jgi:hypothetical protein
MPTTTPEQRVRKARSIATKAINIAAQAKAATGSRSTNSRAAYKIKADALDHVARVLSGKE